MLIQDCYLPCLAGKTPAQLKKTVHNDYTLIYLKDP